MSYNQNEHANTEEQAFEGAQDAQQPYQQQAYQQDYQQQQGYQQQAYQQQGYQQPYASQAYSSAPQEPGPRPDTYLVWAILTTLFCCLPFGIVSIFYAAQVDSRWAERRYDEAYRNSRLAKNWALAAALSGCGCAILYCLYVFVLFGGAMAFALN